MEKRQRQKRCPHKHHIDRLKEASLHVPRGKSISSRANNINFDYQYGKDTRDTKSTRTGKIILKQNSITYPNTKTPAYTDSMNPQENT